MKALLVVSAFLIFVSGAANGLHETLVWRYAKFEKKYPSANERYWNPQESWKNKYIDYPENQKERFFGAKTFLVFLTDAKHLFSELHLDLLIIGVMLLTIVAFRRGWRWAVFAIPAAAWIVQAVGFHTVYTIWF